jgi:putative endonuclease
LAPFFGTIAIKNRIMFWAYVLENPSGKFYIGQTEDLEARLRSHNDDQSPTEGKFTRKNGPWALVWSEAHPDRASAVRPEREIKAWKSSRLIRTKLLGRNEHLSGRVPTCRD